MVSGMRKVAFSGIASVDGRCNGERINGGGHMTYIYIAAAVLVCRQDGLKAIGESENP